MPVLDQDGTTRFVAAATEHALTIRTDGDELITLMTIGSNPEHLVLGYLRNQGLIRSPSDIESVEVDWERGVAEVATRAGLCLATGASVPPAPLPQERRRFLRAGEVAAIVSLVGDFNAVYRESGSVHGCGLIVAGEMYRFVEDVGRHNATDALAGWMWLHDISPADSILYTTGRLTTEIVAKAALMEISVVVSRNGVTERAVSLAEELGVMLVARARRQRFQVFSCHERFEETNQRSGQ